MRVVINLALGFYYFIHKSSLIVTGDFRSSTLFISKLTQSPLPLSLNAASLMHAKVRLRLFNFSGVLRLISAKLCPLRENEISAKEINGVLEF